MYSDGLQAIKDLREKSADSKLLDIIENEIIELNDTLDALATKYSMFDYWRDNCIKYGKILDILKECPFVLSTIYENTNNVDYIKRYGFDTITDEQLNVIKEWLGL